MDVRADGDIAENFWWRRTTLTRRTPLYDACVSAGLLVAATIVGALLDHPGLAPSIMIVYVFAVQLCAFFTWSRLYCLLSSAAAVALYNFLFVGPRYSLSFIDRVYPGMFFIMFVVSLVSSSIALALRRALAQAAASDRRTHMVLETNRMLQRCADQQQIVHAMATQLARLSGCPVVWYSADAEGDDLLPRATYTAVGDAAPVHELAPQMPPRLSASAYVGTPLDATYGGSAFYGIYLTVRTGDGFVRSGDPASVVGVLAVVAESDVLTHEERTLADAIVSEGELALDRARAMEAREEAAVLAKTSSCAPTCCAPFRTICVRRSPVFRAMPTCCSTRARPARPCSTTRHAAACSYPFARTRNGSMPPSRTCSPSPSLRATACICRLRSSSWTISSRRRCAT